MLAHIPSHTPRVSLPKKITPTLPTIPEHQPLTLDSFRPSPVVDRPMPIDGREVIKELIRTGVLQDVTDPSLVELLRDIKEANKPVTKPVPQLLTTLEEPGWLLAGQPVAAPLAGPRFTKETEPATPEEIDKVLEERGGTQVREDHYPGIDTTGAQKGAPSYRVDGNLHASGQPTVKALKEIFERATKNGEKPVWVNLREEPVIYIGDTPHNVRSEDFANMEGDEIAERYPWVKDLMDRKGVSSYEELSVADKRGVVEKLERQEKQRLLKELEAPPKGYILLHTEVPDANGKGQVQARWVRVKPEQIQTTTEVVDKLKETYKDLEYHRLPVTDEHSPSGEVYDALTDLGRRENTCILVNCHAGRGRTSTALAILNAVQNTEATSDVERLLRSLGGAISPLVALGDVIYQLLETKLSMDQIAERLKITDPKTLDVLTHLRQDIQDARADGKTEKVEQFKERYARLLLFGIYLKSGSEESFSDWLEARGWLEDMVEAMPVETPLEKKAA